MNVLLAKKIVEKMEDLTVQAMTTYRSQEGLKNDLDIYLNKLVKTEQIDIHDKCTFEICFNNQLKELDAEKNVKKEFGTIAEFIMMLSFIEQFEENDNLSSIIQSFM